MKTLPFAILMFIMLLSCGNNTQQRPDDFLCQYRDTLIGKFNSIDIDTLICEPLDSLDSDYKGFHYKWRVFTKNGTVRPLTIDNQTIGIHFVTEEDLDRNGTDEWGYVTEWETSNWMNYHLFTNQNGEWQHMIEPIPIYTPHLDSILAKDAIIQPTADKEILRVKFSDVPNNGEDFLIIDTLIRINPHKINGFY